MSDVETVTGEKVRIRFDTKLCIHSRGCVLARPDVFGPAATWAYPIALGILLVDLLFLVLDLGQPSRFHHMLRVVKPSSPMSLGTWCLTAYSLPLTVAAACSLFGWEDARRIAAEDPSDH